VALLFDHDAPLAAAILGALFAGRIFVPLDPTHPRSRLASMIEDAGAAALIADEGNRALAESLAGPEIPIVDVSSDRAPSLTPVDPASVAYILYTSGSTGRPKGVHQSHENLLLQIGAYAGSIAIRPSDRLTLLSSYAVDAALMDLFGALLAGASVHLWDLRSKGLAGLSAWMIERRIRIYHSTPTVYRHWVADLDPGAFFPAVRRIVLGGEPARASDLAPLGRHFGRDTVLVNGLGPTESTIALQAFYTAGDIESATDPLPVGRPAADTKVLLFDDRGQIVEDEGEIVLRSRRLALGYWRRPEETAAKFLPDPEGGERRLYRTGDRGRRLADGRFVFLGRTDAQIKLRGHRIEPGEIEAHLREDPSVREAAISLREAPGGEPILVAHVERTPSSRLVPEALRARLGAVLPESMVPARIIVVDALPLTPGGKIDRSAIAALPLPSTRGEAPAIAAEAWIADLYGSILGVPADPESDFFALGGHSLLAIRLLSRLRAEAHVDLPLRAVFESPTVAELAARIDEAARSGPWIDRDPILPVPRGSIAEASFAQDRLWFADRLRPGDPSYHVPALLRFRGPFDRAALSRAIDAIVQRHEALRTTLPAINGRPMQQVNDPFHVEIENLERLGASSAELTEACAEIAGRPFDLASGPLLRAALIALGEEDHALCLILHHAAADGWSMRRLLGEIAVLYQSFREGVPSPLPDPPLQYADGSAWQRKQLSGPRLNRLLASSRDRLAGLEPLDLAADRPRPAIASGQGAVWSGEISPSLMADLAALGREAGVTLHMIFLAAYALLLARCSGRPSVAIGVPTHGRMRAELEDVAGSFVDTLVLRIDVSGALTLRALLGRVRAIALGAHAHADLPFERLVADLCPERDPGRHPLFQAMLLLDNLPAPAIDVDGVEASILDLDLGASLCDLSLGIRPEIGGACHLRWEYATDLFDPETIARYDARFHALIEAFPGSLDRPAEALPVLGERERRTLLEGFNPARRAHDRTPIHRRFEAAAARDPAAVAVIAGDSSLTYGELQQRVLSRCAELQSSGVAPGSLVPVPSERSLDLAVEWLAVLAAGAAFVPLDPGWPQERHRIAPSAPRSSTGEEDPAYAIFTSGSTGSPKLAVIPHRGISNRFSWMDGFFGEAPPVTLLTTSPVLDSAVWQLLWPLTRGGVAVIPSAGPAPSAREIPDLAARHRVTILDFVPSVLDAMLDDLIAAAPRLGALRHVILGGEPIRREAVIRLQAAFAGVRVVNLYGPTEASIGCIAHVVEPDEAAPIPVGRPIPNVCAVVLDDRRRLAPLGVAGELYLGGDAVGLGYHGDEGSTREAFIPNPFAERDCPTLYRTGDRARLRVDGAIEILGRIDDQLKIRGLRVEPGEIERAILACPGVREAAVIGRRSASGDTDLVAWIAPEGAVADLDRRLRERLPGSLVPSRFAGCDALPRTSAGKIDRRSLASRPLPDVPRTRGEKADTPLERAIAAIWAEALGIASPPLDAGFFELGGHSLLITRVHARLEREIGRPIPLVELFRHPTVRTLARHLSAGEAPPDAASPRPDLDFRAAALRRQRERRSGPR
jgi:amino acid adenylation domain-containing protein